MPINKFAISKSLKIQNKIYNSCNFQKMQALSKGNIKPNNLFKFIKRSDKKTAAIPLVATPILAYMATTKKIREEREYNKQEEANNRFKLNDTEWNEAQSRKTLAAHNITSKQEQDKYIGSDGKLNSDGNKKTSFKASSDDSSTSDTTTDLDVSDDIITDSVKDFVSDALPVYNAARVIQKVCEGDEEEIVKQSVGVIDNVVCQPVKQAVASAVAAKGALIGSIFGPIGAGAGAVIGYAGTLLGWGKARNSIVKKIMKKD